MELHQLMEYGEVITSSSPVYPTSNKEKTFSLIQIMKIVSPVDTPRPYRLVETFVTSEGMRTRICSGAYYTIGQAEFQRESLEKVLKGGGRS